MFAHWLWENFHSGASLFTKSGSIHILGFSVLLSMYILVYTLVKSPIVANTRDAARHSVIQVVWPVIGGHTPANDLISAKIQVVKKRLLVGQL
jgi:hypothetical protein